MLDIFPSLTRVRQTNDIKLDDPMTFYSLLGHAWLPASLFCFSLALAIGAQFEKGRLKR